MTDVDMAAGIRAAADAVEAIAAGDEARARAVLNSLTRGQAAWCAAALLGGWRDSLMAIADGDAVRVGRAMQAGAAVMRGDDLVVSRFTAAVAAHERGTGRD